MGEDKTVLARRSVEAVRDRIKELDEDGLDLLFREARSHNGWDDQPVSNEQLHRIYDLMKMGPTSNNCCPSRIKFLRSDEAKERLRPAIVEANIHKTMTAPVVAIIGHDLAYSDHLDRLYPNIPEPLGRLHRENTQYIADTALRNGSLQGAYLIIATRAVGLDCGAISGFDNAMVDVLFFAGTPIKSNFICNIGYGEAAKVKPKYDRFTFDEVCEIL